LISSLTEENDHFAMAIQQLDLNCHEENLEGEDSTQEELMRQVQACIEKKKEEIVLGSRTGKVWILYIDMIRRVRNLIAGERMGSWELHLQAIYECLPMFAAAGHNNYLKSAYYYLQNMTRLHTTHPEIHAKFIQGHHVLRRSDNFWAGISCDLAIEQTLMRSLKASGGLTHSSKMTEEMRAQWALSSPLIGKYNAALQNFNGLTHGTNARHKELTRSSINTDHVHFNKMYQYLSSHSPFVGDGQLKNIATGAIAPEGTNVDQALELGDQSTKALVGKKVFATPLKRNDRAKTMADNHQVKITKEKSIDPALLFQRLLITSRAGDISLEEAMTYELCPYPAALFESREVMLSPDKSQLTTVLVDFVTDVSPDAVLEANQESGHYVLDGGSLIHRLPWKEGTTFGNIASSYVQFTLRNYGQATVVFDGYPDAPSTKDNMHRRRCRGASYQAEVQVNPEVEFTGKKGKFLG